MMFYSDDHKRKTIKVMRPYFPGIIKIALRSHKMLKCFRDLNNSQGYLNEPGQPEHRMWDYINQDASRYYNDNPKVGVKCIKKSNFNLYCIEDNSVHFKFNSVDKINKQVKTCRTENSKAYLDQEQLALFPTFYPDSTNLVIGYHFDSNWDNIEIYLTYQTSDEVIWTYPFFDTKNIEKYPELPEKPLQGTKSEPNPPFTKKPPNQEQKKNAG